MFPIWKYGSKEQKDRWIPALAKGEAIGCFGLTEPDFGSNPGGMRTVAKKDGDHWVLNGAKAWITNGSIADVAVVWAKVGGYEGRIHGFLVEKGTPGFTTSEHRMKMSLRAAVTSQLAFEDCRIPEENVLPGVDGLKGPLSCLTQARYGISWGGIGSAMATYTCALDYAKSRKQFMDRPIASHQMVQEKLAFMITEITKGQLLALQLGRMKDAGTMKPEHVSMAKRNNVWVARECAKLAREILGANGIVGEYPVFRHLANIESVFTYEGTHDIHTLVLGPGRHRDSRLQPPRRVGWRSPFRDGPRRRSVPEGTPERRCPLRMPYGWPSPGTSGRCSCRSCSNGSPWGRRQVRWPFGAARERSGSTSRTGGSSPPPRRSSASTWATSSSRTATSPRRS